MGILIIAAESVSHADEITNKLRKKEWNCHVNEEEKLGNFLYNHRLLFENYEYYDKFEPYSESFISADEVIKIREFAQSILKWLEHTKLDENMVIDRHSVSFPKIRKYARKLSEVCDFAIDNDLGLVGYGD